MNTHPKSHPAGSPQPDQPEVQPEVAELAPIPADIDRLAKIPLPEDPSAHLSPSERRLKEAKEHALNELAYLQNPEIIKTREDLQQELHVDLARTIEYLGEHPHTISKLTPQVGLSLINHFPGFLLTIISHPEVSAEDAEQLLHKMIQKLGARRMVILAKSKDKELRAHINTWIVNMGKRDIAVLYENPENREAQEMRTSSLTMLVAGVLDNLLHFELKKEQMHDLEQNVKLIFSENYRNWTKSVLVEYPDREILAIARSAMKHFPKEKFVEQILERISREKKESIFAKIAPEMSQEALTKVLIKRETEAVREEILRKVGKMRGVKVFKRPLKDK